MNAKKKILSALLCGAIILGMTACDNSGSTPSSTTTSAAATTSNTLDDDNNNPVDIDEFVTTEEEKSLENPNLLYLGFYDMRMAGDIKPGVKLFEETYGGTIDYETVPWGDRMDKLQTKISTGQSPDLVDEENITFPYMMNKNVYTDMTEYFKPYMSEPQWTEGVKELIERYSWNGKHYFYPFTISALPNCLIYDADLFNSLGIENPKELYDRNEWDWNSFKNIMIEFIRKNPEAIGGVYGILGSDIFLSTGMPLIAVEDGKIINNMNNPTIDRAADFLMELRKENFAVIGDGTTEQFVDGKMAFFGVGTWKITDLCKQYPNQTFEFVPYPRDPLADKYYYNTNSFSYMVPSGAPNPEGAAAFINIMRKCQVDPELKEVMNQSIMNEKKYSQEQFDFLTRFENIDNYDMIIEGYSGFNDDLTNIIDTMLTNVAFEQGESQKSWTQLRTEQEGAINSYLAEYE